MSGFARAILVIISFIKDPSFETDFKNFFLAGTLKNKSLTSIIVPLFVPHSYTSPNLPPSIFISYPYSEFAVFDFKFTLATEAIEARASPLKPKVLILYMSSDFVILLVACGMKAFFISSLNTPSPSSIILMRDVPPSSISIVIFFEAASIEFSTNSFTTEEGLSTTSPAAILLAVSSFNMLILFISVNIPPFTYLNIIHVCSTMSFKI